jgi:hypothetical protein
VGGLKYRRHPMKIRSRNKLKFLLIISGILIFAFIIATLFSKLIFKQTGPFSKDAGKDYSAADNKNLNVDVVKFILVQGGVYKNKDSADKVQETLKDYGSIFSVQQGENTKIYLGLYSERDGNGLLKTLKDKNIDCTKTEFAIYKTDLCNNEIIAVFDAELQIINKLQDKSIKSIKTDDLKKWTSSLQNVDKDSRNYKVLSEFKNYITSLPAELTRDTSEDNYRHLYTFIKAIK